MSRNPAIFDLDAGIAGTDLIRQPLHGLTDDLQVPDDGVNGLPVLAKLVQPHGADVQPDPFARRQNVFRGRP